MPQPSTPTANGSYVDLNAAPGADMNFDDLFPAEDSNLSASQTPTGTTPPVAPQATPVNPAAPEVFIRAGSTVYRTPEDAVTGIQHKDTLIDKYRRFLTEKGVNPDTLQSSQPQAPVQPAPPAEAPSTYLGHEEALFDDLSAAISRGDKKGYGRLLATYNQQLMTEQFAPVAPLISEVARQRSVRQVSLEAPGFSEFQSSAAYPATLDSLPRLKEAIQIAETNFSASDSLSELYKIAYLAFQGQRQPSAPVVPTPTVQPVAVAPNIQQPFRPTSTPSAMTPPQPSAPADMRTSAGRQTLIRDLEARGIKDYSF